MAATSEEQMNMLLSSFDQIYEDFKSGMNEINVYRSKSNVETTRREALEISNKTLKEENERLKKLYTESLNSFADQLEHRTKCHNMKEELKRVNDENKRKEHEFRNALQSLRQKHVTKVEELENKIRSLLVCSVTKQETSVWRPTTTITSLGDAVGCIIAWPLDKINLQTMDSPNGVKTAGSVATSAFDDNKVLIFDWISEELIAEGTLYSTDPKELVNNISLGPNAAIVTVSKVVREGAFLWRPSADMSCMGDALHENIVWPIHKLEFTRQQSRHESVSKNASPKSASVSVINSTDTSKGVKKKCILLDCSGTGERVAEGRVCSTNPTDVVHFVPLGPNASKVWVEVCKVKDAPVWRPNSEVEIISDALGTTVAWPNDKLLFI